MTPGQPDVALIRRHLLAMDRTLQVLERHRGRSIEELSSNREELWIVERGLQLCAQNALDIATHLSVSAGHDVPDYGTAMDRLAELAILPRDFAATFRAIAGFRNVLVHAYLEVDLSIVHRLLNERLGDFSEFSRHVEAYLVSRDRS